MRVRGPDLDHVVELEWVDGPVKVLVRVREALEEVEVECLLRGPVRVRHRLQCQLPSRAAEGGKDRPNLRPSCLR